MNIFMIVSTILKRKRLKLAEAENKKKKIKYIKCPKIREEFNVEQCVKCKYNKKVSKNGRDYYLCNY